MKNKNHNYRLRELVCQYTTSVIQMIDNITSDNINQTISLIKANIKVLESDVSESFAKRTNNNYNNDRIYN